MGLFSKHKNSENKVPVVPPVAPPAPVNALSAGSLSSNNVNSNISSLSNPPSIPDSAGTLSPPPIPGGSLSDIKSQVISNGQSDFSGVNNMSVSSSVPVPPPMPVENSNFGDLTDDSLFDFSGLDIPEAEPSDNGPMADRIISNTSNSNPKSLDSKFQRRLGSEHALDSNIESKSNLNFVSNKDVRHKIEENETYFLTTSQFKSLLEIVDSVKERVKISSDTHLRLLDIKSEEDIEYENLRKDFQFIEDKLYEVDSIIFDK